MDHGLQASSTAREQPRRTRPVSLVTSAACRTGLEGRLDKASTATAFEEVLRGGSRGQDDAVDVGAHMTPLMGRGGNEGRDAGVGEQAIAKAPHLKGYAPGRRTLGSSVTSQVIERRRCLRVEHSLCINSSRTSRECGPSLRRCRP
jgi:hypothetical protein